MAPFPAEGAYGLARGCMKDALTPVTENEIDAYTFSHLKFHHQSGSKTDLHHHLLVPFLVEAHSDEALNLPFANLLINAPSQKRLSESQE